MRRTPPELVHWRLMFRVANRRALDRCLSRTLPLLGDGSKLMGRVGPYWKSPELWECTVACPPVSGTAAEQAAHWLRVALELGGAWQIGGSLSHDPAMLWGVFDVRGNHTHVRGLEWASFDWDMESAPRRRVRRPRRRNAR
jgi:hypothetical protein